MSTKMARILIVDDEPDYAATLALAIRADGMDAQSVDSARKAIAILEDTSVAPPDLMITDILMPGMSGEELIGMARRIVPEMPILAMTSFGDKQMIIRLMRRGCSDYIEKPFTTEEIRRHIEPILARRNTVVGSDDDSKTIRRLAAIGRNVAGFAHDINNQLAAMNGFGELLSETATDTRQAQYCSSLRKCFYRVGNMVNSVMAAAGNAVPSISMERIRVRDMIDTIVELSNLRTRDIRVSVRDECAVWGHRARIESAIWNILKNADEALSGRAGARIEIQCSLSGSEVTVSIRDNGPGIAPQIREKLFGIGQTYGKRKGNGLGLYSARKSIEDSGGKLWCDSEPGKGAVFHLRLSIYAIRNETGHETSTSASS